MTDAHVVALSVATVLCILNEYNILTPLLTQAHKHRLWLTTAVIHNDEFYFR